MGELGKKMIRYMELRNFSPKTKQAYIHQMKGLVKFYNKPPQQLGRNELEKYLHHLYYEKKLSWSNVNIAFSAFKFFYERVLGNALLIDNIPRPKAERRLPQVLDKSEVAAIFAATVHPKYRLFFMTIYSAGLRISEAGHLKVNDIDSKRMLLRVDQGKGKKDRYTILSTKLLGELRRYWLWQRPQHWLFPADKACDKPINDSSSRKSFNNAKKKRALKSRLPYTPCAIVSQLTYWKPAMIFSLSRNSWGTRVYRPPAFTPTFKTSKIAP